MKIQTYSQHMDYLEEISENIKFDFQKLQEEEDQNNEEKEDNKLLPSECWCELFGCDKCICEPCGECGWQ